MTSVPRRRTVDDLVADARAQLVRLDPHQARDAQRSGAVLVDIRPVAQRLAQGEVPGARVVERNHLEWRYDPACDARVPEASYDLRVVVLCEEGWTSSLAAAALRELGVPATDLDGGFVAWRDAGLPVVPGGTVAGEHSPAEHSRAEERATAG